MSRSLAVTCLGIFPQKATKCLIPRFDGAILSQKWKEALWDRFVTGAPLTTHAVRSVIQRSQASLAQLSRELGINSRTVAEWCKRATVEDCRTGSAEPRSTALTKAEEAAVVAFRRHALLPQSMTASMPFTPYEYTCRIWTSEPDRFIVNPIHQMPGLNTFPPFAS